MLWKCSTQYANKFGKLSSGHRTGKGQFSLQFQRKAMPNNVQVTTQLHSSHMLANNAQNSPSQAPTVHEPSTSRLQQFISQEPQKYKLSFWRGRGTRDQIANMHWIMEKKRELQKNISFIDWSLWLCGSQHTVENSLRNESTRPPYLSPENPACRVRTNN